MFDFVRTHSRVMFFLIVLLIFPSFVFFGVQGYSRFDDPSNQPVARVDGQMITRAEWDAAHRRQVEQARARMPNLDPSFSICLKLGARRSISWCASACCLRRAPAGT